MIFETLGWFTTYLKMCSTTNHPKNISLYFSRPTDNQPSTSHYLFPTHVNTRATPLSLIVPTWQHSPASLLTKMRSKNMHHSITATTFDIPKTSELNKIFPSVIGNLPSKRGESLANHRHRWSLLFTVAAATVADQMYGMGLLAVGVVFGDSSWKLRAIFLES